MATGKPAKSGFSFFRQRPKRAQLKHPAPPVQMTGILRADLRAEGIDDVELAKMFANWKRSWPDNEYEYFYFGKDAYYARPLRAGKQVLRHVHIAPEDDSPDIEQWTYRWQRRQRKTSDAVLIYAHEPQYGYLLIHLAKEPYGHQIGEMRSPTTAKLMNDFADIADAFMFDGTILV